jgi:hypothetical protein
MRKSARRLAKYVLKPGRTLMEVEVVVEAVAVEVAVMELVAETAEPLGMIKPRPSILVFPRLMGPGKCIAPSVMGGMRLILPNIMMSTRGLLLHFKYQHIIPGGLLRARSFQGLLSLVGLRLLAQLQLEVLLLLGQCCQA